MLHCFRKNIPPPHEQTAFIVYKSQLWLLFDTCPICSSATEVDTRIIGTFLRVSQNCAHCNYFREWDSQPFINSLPAGNILLSAAVFFTGSSFAKIERVFSSMNICSTTSSTFYSHAKSYLQPCIYTLWRENQRHLIDNIKQRGGEVIIGGDMRADSPG